MVKEPTFLFLKRITEPWGDFVVLGCPVGS